MTELLVMLGFIALVLAILVPLAMLACIWIKAVDELRGLLVRGSMDAIQVMAAAYNLRLDVAEREMRLEHVREEAQLRIQNNRLKMLAGE